MGTPAASRGWRAAIAFLPALALAAAGAAEPAPDADRRADAARLMNELMSGKDAVGAAFTLTDQFGKRRSLAEFRGKIVLLYFGYTFCPDVCPTDLAAIAQLLTLLGAEGETVQPIFVTLDPERDTQNVLRRYAAAFSPRIIALRGSTEQTRHIATAWKVFYEKVTPPGSRTYVIDHSAFTFLLDREGKYVSFFPPGTPAGRMAVMVSEQLAEPAGARR
jgi:protein SCO1/2